MNRGDSLTLWALIAVASPTSEIACQVVAGAVPVWLIWFRIAVLVVVLAMAAYAKRLRILRPFCFAYLFQLMAVAALAAARGSSQYHSIVSRDGFIEGQLFLELVALVLIAPVVVWCLRRRDRFYLRIRELSDPVEPIWAGTDIVRLPWSWVAPVFAVGAALCAWAFVGFEGETVPKSWVMVPWAVLFAAGNAFLEEFVNRNVLAGSVQMDFGAQHAIVVSAFIFGIGHWNGLPAGAIGVLMTFVLGYVAAKAMVETKGMFWPWFMHALPDCVRFYYWGIGSVAHATIGSGRF